MPRRKRGALERAGRERSATAVCRRAVAAAWRMVSGGPDSACLAAALVAPARPQSVAALHVNYGLREDSGEDEARCRALCARLGIELRVERPSLDPPATSRPPPATPATRRPSGCGPDAGSTGSPPATRRTDLAETVLYRLAVSPGAPGAARPAAAARSPRAAAARRSAATRRARLAARPGCRSATTPRTTTRASRATGSAARCCRCCASSARRRRRTSPRPGPSWPRRPSRSSGLARRALATARAEPARVVDPRRGARGRGTRRCGGSRCASSPSASPAATFRSAARAPSEIWRLAAEPEGGEVELGGGLRAVCERGLIRFAADARRRRARGRRRSRVPGECRFGGWEVRAELPPAPVEPPGPDVATLDADALGGRARSCARGARATGCSPLGLDGTKSLQDLFTDRKVPRSLRHRCPWSRAEDRIAWVAGVAVSEEFRLRRRHARCRA